MPSASARPTGPHACGAGTDSRHHRLGSRCRVALAVGSLCALALAAAACTSAPSAPSSGASTRVPASVRAAVTSMERAANFSFVATVHASNGSTKLHGQFEAPDREDVHFQAPNGTTSEVLFVGTKAYQKGADGTWRDALGGPAQPSDPRSAFSALLTARYAAPHAAEHPCTLSPAQASAIVKGSGGTGTVHCAVWLDGNHVSALQLNAANFDATITYSGVGTTPPVPQP